MELNDDLSVDEAREIIIDTGVAIGRNINHRDLARILGFK